MPSLVVRERLHPAQTTHPMTSSRRVAFVCAALKILVTLSSAVSAVPRLRLLESSVCRTYYQARHMFHEVGFDGRVPEELCKKNLIQSDLTFLLGWHSFFGLLPGLFCLVCAIHGKRFFYSGQLTRQIKAFVLAIPYSALSERIDRRVLLFVGIVSSIFSQLYMLIICTRRHFHFPAFQVE